MHYLHYLSERQKRLAIFSFMAFPVVVLVLLMALWANNRGLFTPMVRLKTVVKSAQGIDSHTMVTLSGIAIGTVSKTDLRGPEEIELTLRIEKKYQGLIRADSEAMLAAQNIVGVKEVRIRGGSKGAPVVADGASLKSVEFLEMENLSDRVTPIINAAERIVLKLDQIVDSFPNERLNSSVRDVSEILAGIKDGKSSVGRLVSTDKGELYAKLDGFIKKLNDISANLDEATKRLPETMENAAQTSRNAMDASKGWPEMQKTLQDVLKNMNRVLDDVAAMTPSVHKTVDAVGAAAQDASKTASRIPALLDDVETTLNDTMTMVQSLKSSWPMKNLVPAEKNKAPFEPGLRESPYGDGKK
ncbi:MAG: MCE family protein [Nitrospinae bacterium]|nr:MCE family protein [Nitrospinota bacterium]